MTVNGEDPELEIVPADNPRRLFQAKLLFEEYLVILLKRHQGHCFGNLQAETDGWPGVYAAPAGCLLIALLAGQAVGCVGLRLLEDGRGEMKRLYVEGSARGHGAGRRLVKS